MVGHTLPLLGLHLFPQQEAKKTAGDLTEVPGEIEDPTYLFNEMQKRA